MDEWTGAPAYTGRSVETIRAELAVHLLTGPEEPTDPRDHDYRGWKQQEWAKKREYLEAELGRTLAYFAFLAGFAEGMKRREP